MSTMFHWWSRYGDFPPGLYVLPHMGKVIAHYRIKAGYETQKDLSIVAGVSKRKIEEWESSMYIQDLERRIFLAKALKIPAALLGLDWHLVAYRDNLMQESTSLDHMTNLIEEDGYYTYEDLLVFSWHCFYTGRLADIADRFQRRLRKLNKITRSAPTYEQEAWQVLLGQYYQFSTLITECRGMSDQHKAQVLQENATSIKIATDVNDAELLGLAQRRLITIHLVHKEYDLARTAAQEALLTAKRLRNTTPLWGNILLSAAEAFAPFAATDERLVGQVRQWQDEVLNILWKQDLEEDSSFLKLNLASVHHERARLLLQLYQFYPHNRELLKDARSELALAWKAFTPDLNAWKTYFQVTEARLLKAEGDLDGSAKAGVQALHTAKLLQSEKEQVHVKALYEELTERDATNPHIRRLGIELGIY